MADDRLEIKRLEEEDMQNSTFYDYSLYQRREKKKRRLLIYSKNANFRSYIKKMLRNLGGEGRASISEQSLEIFDDIILDMFTELAQEAQTQLRAKCKRTLQVVDIEFAVALKLQSEVAKPAVSYGNKAVASYINMNVERRLLKIEEEDTENSTSASE